ncbi:threonylcarbamoyl-AMP synthase [Labrys miyagiensis]
MLRPGGLSREAVENVLGFPLAEGPEGSGDEPIAPGMLTSHYAPRAHVRLDAESPRPGEAWLGFGGDGADGAAVSANLSAASDLTEAAANLFGMLRALDRPGISAIAVARIPAHGLGEAIRDRLERAAAER